MKLLTQCSFGAILLFLTVTGHSSPTQAPLQLQWSVSPQQKIVGEQLHDHELGPLSQDRELVAVITSDTHPDQPQRLYLTYDNVGHLTGVVRIDGDSGEVSSFTLQNLREGIVFMKSSGKDVLKLIGPNTTAAAGGKIQLIYLTNGFSNTYKTLELKISFKQQIWKLLAKKGSSKQWAEVERLHIKGRRIMGRVIGIAKITAIFAPGHQDLGEIPDSFQE